MKDMVSKMAHGIESNDSMFYTRVKPWHGLGNRVEEALTSKEALIAGGIDWNVVQKPIFIGAGDDQTYAPQWVANTRSDDGTVLGLVTPKYQIVQNTEAFSFTDALLQNKDIKVTYETAGSLHNGRKVWLLARMPDIFLNGERTEIYLVFFNSHDGSSGLSCACTPVRVVCANTLNLAITGAKRIWTTRHTGDMTSKMEEAKRTLGFATEYVEKLQMSAVELANQLIDRVQLEEFLDKLIPVPKEAWGTKKADNIMEQRDGIAYRYFNAPDLKEFQGTAYGVINAVSDYSTHAEPLRKTATWQENRFYNTVQGNDLIDKAYSIARELVKINK